MWIVPLLGLVVGSPPHAWGIRRPTRRTSRSATVHPHTRGEYGQLGWDMQVLTGSPPHAWGIRPVADGPTHVPRFTPTRVGNTQIVGLTEVSAERFTPTRVGNTRSAWPSCCASPVHPHTRGEYAPVFGDVIATGRFTPTRVGNTVATGPPAPVDNGSPPHAWGIPFDQP